MVELIENFVKTYSDLENAVNAGSKEQADALYRKLYDLYRSFGTSGLSQENSEVAYAQVKKAYEKLAGLNSGETKAEPRKKIKLLPVDVVAAGIIIFVLGALLFVKPQWVGLAVFDNERNVDLRISLSQQPYTMTLDGFAGSLKLSGKAAKNSRVYALINSKKYVVFDSSLSQTVDGEFSNACIETCTGLKAKEIALLAEGEVYLSSLTYGLEPNHEPAWIGDTESFAVSVGKERALDMSFLFTDADNDELSYLSTSTSGLDARVSGKMLYLAGKTAGTKEITFIASDGQVAVRKEVNVVVA